MHKVTGHLSHQRESRNLLITVILNLFISVVELIGGLLSNSLALISDALHNFSDGIAILITFITLKISKKEPNLQKTFGYKRIQILAALFNAITLIAICIFLLYEAYDRFVNPQEVKGFSMLLIAAIGLIANIAGVFLLKDFSKNNLNVKAAYLHLIGDTLSSIAVIVAGIFIYFYQWHWIDPLITVLISAYIIYETWDVLAETYNILMQSSPHHLDLKEISSQITMIEGVKNIHHVHVWQLTDQDIHFEGHLELDSDMHLSEAQEIQNKINEMLTHKFNIHHITLQAEFCRCNNEKLISGTNC